MLRNPRARRGHLLAPSLALPSLLLVLLSAGPALAQTSLPRYRLHGQVFPADLSTGYHADAGDLDGDGFAEVLVVANGGSLRLVLNHSTGGTFSFGEMAVPWDPCVDGAAMDAVFLDLLDGETPSAPGDGADDHLFVAVADSEDKAGGCSSAYQDRLYRITLLQEDPVEVAVQDATAQLTATAPDSHNAQRVIATTQVDGAGTLHLVLAGGLFGPKSALADVYHVRSDTLRILRVTPALPTSHFEDATAELIPVSDNPDAVITDLDVIDANGDGRDDLLVTTLFHKTENQIVVTIPSDQTWEELVKTPQLLVYQVASGQFANQTAAFFPDGLPLANTYGAAVGDFLGGTDADIYLLHSQKAVTILGNPLPAASPTVYEHVTDSPGECGGAARCFKTREGAVVWADYRTGDSWGCFNKWSFDGEFIDDTYLVMAAQIPHVLRKEPAPGGGFRLRELDLAGEDGLLSPFVQVYTATDLVVANLDGDPEGVLDIVFTDTVEQNRLWRCGPRGAEPWAPVEDATNAYFAATGDMASRVLVGDFAGTPFPDVVFVNTLGPPEVYVNRTSPEFGFGRLELRPDLFPAAPGEFVCGEQGGWDGALADIDEDGDLDLVLAGGVGWDGEAPNQLYLWEGAWVGFVPQQDPFPGDPSVHSRAVAVGDLDGQNGPDVVFAEGGQIRIYLHDGACGDGSCFSPGTSLSVQNEFSRGLALSRIDDDPHLDIVATGAWGLTGIGFVRVFFNDGTGGFSAAASEAVPAPESPLYEGVGQRLVPLNLDDASPMAEKNDFLLGVSGGPDVLLRHNGSPVDHYFDTTHLTHKNAEDQTYGGAAADLNGDGLDELLVNTFAGRQRMFLNETTVEGETVIVSMSDVSDTVFADGFPTYAADSGIGATLSHLFGGDQPEILIAGDGQNRFLLPDADGDGIIDYLDPDVPCADGDGDGYGDPASPNCGQAERDCDDTSPDANPGVAEICENGGIDDDCDGQADATDTECCRDLDGDGYGDPANPGCTNPELDCDDGDPDVYPGAPESCGNAVDDDCDGLSDDLDPDCCQDLDGDGYGRPSHAGCTFLAQDCLDDPAGDAPVCSQPDCDACAGAACVRCAKCTHPGVTDDPDNDCWNSNCATRNGVYCDENPTACNSECDNCGTLVLAGPTRTGNTLANLALYLLPGIAALLAGRRCARRGRTKRR